MRLEIKFSPERRNCALKKTIRYTEYRGTKEYLVDNYPSKMICKNKISENKNVIFP